MLLVGSLQMRFGLFGHCKIVVSMGVRSFAIVTGLFQALLSELPHRLQHAISGGASILIFAEICCGGITLTSAAASSIASGIPSNRQQMSITAAAPASDAWNSGSALLARSKKSRTDSDFRAPCFVPPPIRSRAFGTDSDGT